MCGRYTNLFKWKQLHRLMTLTTPPIEVELRYNIAPTQRAPVVRQMAAGTRGVDLLRWGLIPSWAGDVATSGGFINARSETIDAKPAFRSSFKHKRCLVPASGFYEWKPLQGAKNKQPMYVVPSTDDEPFVFAGLWESGARSQSGEAIDTYTVLTTSANELMAQIHDRMPVILRPEDFGIWLDPQATVESLRSLLRPFPSELMRMFPVSALVNSPRNDTPECIRPCGTDTLGFLF